MSVTTKPRLSSNRSIYWIDTGLKTQNGFMLIAVEDEEVPKSLVQEIIDIINYEKTLPKKPKKKGILQLGKTAKDTVYSS